jgi:hypothetical protein
VLALGADHPRGPVGKASYWPDGLQELANRADRVHGFFVNAEDVFFYAGKTKALNEFLRDYAKLKDTKLEVVLHVGRKRARSPWDKEDRDILTNWRLYATSRDWIRHAPGKKVAKDEPPTITQVDIWLDDGVQLEELVVPSNVAVRSGGEIEKFIRSHRK